MKYKDRIKTLPRRLLKVRRTLKNNTLLKHLKTNMHRKSSNYHKQEELGAKNFVQHIIEETPIGRGMARMNEKDKESLNIHFNSAYYLGKHERPFTDYPALLDLQEKNGALKFNESYRTDRAAAIFSDFIGESLKIPIVDVLIEANYYALLSDGSTDKAVIEEEVIYVLFLKNDGRVAVRFLSIENLKTVDANGIINGAFE